MTTPGSQAAEHPELVRLEADAGMAVGNHSWDHPWRTPFATLPESEIRAEITQGAAVLRRIGVRSCSSVHRAERSRRSSSARLGSRASTSFSGRSMHATGSKARRHPRSSNGSVRPGSIVATLEALPEIVAGIRRAELELVALAPVG